MNQNQDAETVKSAAAYMKARERYRNDATFHRFVHGLVTMLTTEGYDQDDLIAAVVLATVIQAEEATS